jgi:hypothetical protein
MKSVQKRGNENFLINGTQSERLVFLGLAKSLLSKLPNRSREIIEKRFGLSGEKGETLEKIGKEYDITRERVRQIIAEAIKSVLSRSDNKEFSDVEKTIIFTIGQNNGIIKESRIADKFKLGSFQEINAIKFFVDCSKNIVKIKKDSLIEKSWAVSENAVTEAKKIAADAEKILNEGGKLLNDEEISRRLIACNAGFSLEKVLGHLDIAGRVKKNHFGKWGLDDWMEINPKGTKEKVYLVLKEYKCPLHFTEVANLIDKHFLIKKGKKAHPQTVHNELIKDQKFILIGRGTYALKEWGYYKGTVRDVLKKILEEKKKPLKREEIMKEILKMRKVKEATVMINLNNNKFFEKIKGGYMLKK